MYKSERHCIKHSGSRLFMFRTWIIRQRNTVWVRKLTYIVTSLWLGIIVLPEELFNVTYIWELFGFGFNSNEHLEGQLLLGEWLRQQNKAKYHFLKLTVICRAVHTEPILTPLPTQMPYGFQTHFVSRQLHLSSTNRQTDRHDTLPMPSFTTTNFVHGSAYYLCKSMNHSQI